ncbi:hypothetical protein BJX63DRAFT_384416 [Aspergillus granulosus]|uniref:Uncharacterized protein n=1 Tax=Aspergillus granulosus TaxID=176169 RepID=A0ABR4HRQ5_9EURO
MSYGRKTSILGLTSSTNYYVKPRALAVQLAKVDLFFQELTIDNITSGSGGALSALNTRWNRICRAVEECSTAGQSFDL